MAYRQQNRGRNAGESYLDALSIAHKWLWIAEQRATELGRDEEATVLASCRIDVATATEQLTLRAPAAGRRRPSSSA